MGKKYNLNSKSSMRKFARDLEKNVMAQAKSTILNGTHQITCPNCKHTFGAHVGKNICPFCRKTVDLTLDM